MVVEPRSRTGSLVSLQTTTFFSSGREGLLWTYICTGQSPLHRHRAKRFSTDSKITEVIFVLS